MNLLAISLIFSGIVYLWLFPSGPMMVTANIYISACAVVLWSIYTYFHHHFQYCALQMLEQGVEQIVW